MKTVLIGLAALVLLGCANRPQTGEMRHYACDDGTSFSLEVAESWVRLHTVTGTIELPRDGQNLQLYTNGLRSIILEADGKARHAVGRRAWAECSIH